MELARPLLADFLTSVSRIVAQSFLLVTSVDGKRRKSEEGGLASYALALNSPSTQIGHHAAQGGHRFSTQSQSLEG